ncbi:MAG: MFS transporter [Hamadaea sp.]|nr:MFS transporter [Hamadaea sp.]NUR46963.1 MFS transporter [Hamadaea sp.]NUT05631.1 MFS transporter [Hamadaea sp.]
MTGGLSLVWALWLARDAGDLAAQYAWTTFVRDHPGSAYNLSWYGGIHPASYSVLSPYLMALIGVRTTGVVAAVASTALAAQLLARSGVRQPLPSILWLSVAVWLNLAAGRVTYLLGLAVALLAVVVLLHRRPRPVLAALLGAVATLCSPVAGLFIEVFAAALFLTGRRRPAYLMAAGPPVVIGVTALLFPFSGVQPFHWYSALPTLAAAVAVAALVPRDWATVRAGAWVYAAGVALCWALPTPIGSNVERLLMLAGAAVLMCAEAARERSGWPRRASYAAMVAMAVWTVAHPVVNIVTTAPVTAGVADARPLIDELRRLAARQVRVEVVPLRSHWEAAGLAPYVNLARGWNRQADVARNPIFYQDQLTAEDYRAWLREWSVGYVVLSADEPDDAGIAEAKIITAGHPWLSLVWADADWRVYRVDGVEPLATPPATVTSDGPAAITLDVPRPGAVLIRIAWSPWLAIRGVVDDGASHACLAQHGRWTELSTPTAGTFTIEARYTLDRGTTCPTTR